MGTKCSIKEKREEKDKMWKKEKEIYECKGRKGMRVLGFTNQTAGLRKKKKSKSADNNNYYDRSKDGIQIGSC